jgi:hypothetical protein
MEMGENTNTDSTVMNIYCEIVWGKPLPLIMHQMRDLLAVSSKILGFFMLHVKSLSLPPLSPFLFEF